MLSISHVAKLEKKRVGVMTAKGVIFGAVGVTIAIGVIAVGSTQQPTIVSATPPTVSAEQQKCEADGYKWEDAPWPFSGHFCSRPAAWVCDEHEDDVNVALQVLRHGYDKQSQLQLDVNQGRRGDYYAAQEEQRGNSMYISESEKEVKKAAKEYLDHGCTKNAEQAHRIVDTW